MVDHLISALADRGVCVEPFNMTVTDLGRLATTLVDAATIMSRFPRLKQTVERSPHRLGTGLVWFEGWSLY